MIKKIGYSIVLQALGTISSFLVVWIITNNYGLHTQGQFALIKSWVDLMIVLACFGLPQSFIYAVNKLNISAHYLKNFTLKYILTIILPIAFITYFWFIYVNKYEFSFTDTFILGLAIAFLVGHALFRGLYLTQNDGKLFAIISALPALLLFLFTLINLIDKENLYLTYNYLLSGILSCLIVFVLLHAEKKENHSIPWGDILKNGNSVFIQGIAITLLPIVTYWLMGRTGFSMLEIGIFNISIYIYLIFALPLNMVSPLFFNRWSKYTDIKKTAKELRLLLSISLLIIPLIILLYFLIPLAIPKIFGPEMIKYKGIEAMQILIIASIPLYINNLLACFLGSQGLFKYNTYIYTIKTILCAILIYTLLTIYGKSILYIALSWVASDIVIATLLFIVTVRFLKAN